MQVPWIYYNRNDNYYQYRFSKRALPCVSIVRKHSRKRDAILECLRCTTSHPTAEWVYNQLKPTIPDLSLATVYRNLAIFKAEGTIDSVGVYINA